MKVKNIGDIIKRGAVNIYSETELDAFFASGKKLTVKLGADPSRPDLHLGHSVVLRKLRLFQEMGHKVIFVIGDFTGMIGDPTGKSKTRPKLTLDETRHAGESYFKQVTKILDSDKTEIVYNSTWLNEMSFEEVIELASSYTLARILERDDFKKRVNENKPLGLHELLYPLVQGYDSVAIDADIEVGGTDQTFNLLVGRSLMERYGKKPQVVMTFPILPGLDGVQKMSKSLDNYIGIDESAAIMFEKCMKVPDSLLGQYFELTTDVDMEVVQKLLSGDIRAAHFEYAKTIVEMYHGKHEAEIARKRYERVARGGVPSAVKEITVAEETMPLVKLVAAAGFANSASEARRIIAGKGIRIDGETQEDIFAQIDITGGVVVQFGKSRFVKIKGESGL